MHNLRVDQTHTHTHDFIIFLNSGYTFHVVGQTDPKWIQSNYKNNNMRTNSFYNY